MNDKPIGIFDSGIGGLTVLKEYLKILPNENYIYYADTKNLPYGNKTKEQIIEYSKNIVEFLISKNVKAIIIACGTASSLAYTYLKEHFNIPIFNIIEPTVKNLNEKNIGVIATEASISSQVWKKEIHKYNPDCNVIVKACPKLVPLAEKGLFNSQETQKVLEEYLSGFENVDCLILGCTHYPLFSDSISKLLGNKVKLINAGKYSALEFKENFALKNNSSHTKNKVYLYVNGNKVNFLETIKKIEMTNLFE